MTERSWLWDGTTTGDASLAAYDKEAFNTWFAMTKAHNINKIFIIPGVYQDLYVEPLGSQSYSTVKVNPGAALFKDYIYISTEAEYFELSSVSASNYYRYDSLVLRQNRTTQEIRLVLVNGTETTGIPQPPTLTQTDTIWEIEIARIYIDSTSFVLDEQHLEVFFDFLPIGPYFNGDTLNLFKNSESFIWATDVVLPTILGGWIESPVYQTLQTAPVISPQTRGQSFSLPTFAQDDTLRQQHQIKVKEGDPFTLEGLLRLNDATSIIDITITTYEREDNLLGGSTAEHNLRVWGEGIHHIKRTFYAQHDIGSLTVKLTGVAATNDIDIGQFLLSPGYFTGGFRPKHEIIPIQLPLADSAWDGDAKSSGTTQINLATSFGGKIPAHARGVILYVRARDSGSAAGTFIGVHIQSYNSTLSYGSLLLDGEPNNAWQSRQIIAYIDEPFKTSLASAYGFAVQVTASGAGTLDAIIRIIGIIT